jgi:serine protease AprX
MRRYLILIALVIAALTSWPAEMHGQRFPSLSGDLAKVSGDRVRVIVQGDDSALSNVRRRHARGHRRDLAGGIALELTRAEFESLKRDSSLAHISGDLPVTANMAVTNKVTLAEKVWQGTSGLLGLLGTPGYNGSGINVAVIDSGIAPHSAIGNRVVARVNFVSSEPGVVGDPFGHGTHVAGMIGGNGAAAKYVTSAYSGGSAPGIKFVDVRVLGRSGVGFTSEVIAGIDWAISNRSKYNIRVINLSLGHPVAESSTTDPLCRAVERAAASGITVVVSAGNYGVTPSGAPILGGVTSPGNSPSAITVGALDTKGTVDRNDDDIAPYSSRGPTRFDWTVKPDVVAPGTRIVSLEAAGSYISSTYRSWHVAGSGTNAYNRLSGTSMSTAVVSGGVALLLDAYPGLSPAQVKLLLQSGARFVPSGGLIGGGTGSVDFNASVKLADNGLISTVLSAVQNLLGLSSGASFRDRGTLIDRIYDRSGINLLSILNLGRLLGGADDSEYGVLNLLGQQNTLGYTPANYVVWGSVADWSSSYYVVWGSSMQSPSGQYVVWGSSMYGDGDYVVWGSGQFPSDGGR